MLNNPKKPIQVNFTPEFKRNIRQLSKKYRHIKSDVQPVIEQLETGQTPGEQIPRVRYSVFKIRIRNTDIKKGKRARLSDGLLCENPNFHHPDYYLLKDGTRRCVTGDCSSGYR